MADKSVARLLKELDRRADLHHLAILHHHDLIGESQRLGLVMRDINHRRAELLVQFLQLGAQQPFEVRVDDRQRLVKHDDIDVFTHQAAAKRYFLLAVSGQPRGALFQHAGQVRHLGNCAHALVHLRLRHAAVAQGERQIVVDAHRVVHDRKLENLRDIALVCRQSGDVPIAEQHLAMARNRAGRK